MRMATLVVCPFMMVSKTTNITGKDVIEVLYGIQRTSVHNLGGEVWTPPRRCHICTDTTSKQRDNVASDVSPCKQKKDLQAFDTVALVGVRERTADEVHCKSYTLGAHREGIRDGTSLRCRTPAPSPGGVAIDFFE